MAQIDPKQIKQAGASTNDVLAWDGSEWVPTTPSGGGGGWTDDGTTVRLTTAGDEVSIGSDTALANTKLSVYADSATQKPIAIRLAATPTADAIEIQDSTGTKLFGLTAGCNVFHIPAASFAISDSAVSALGASSLAIGYQSDATANSTTALGYGAQATGSFSVAVGTSATVGAAANTVVVGSTATATASGAVSVGFSADATGNNSIAIGNATQATGTYATALGSAANAAHGGSICIGRDAASTAAQQLIIGSTAGYIDDVYIGRGVTSATPSTTLKLNPTGGSGTDIAGSGLIIAGGRGTGAGAGGTVKFQVAPAGGTGSSLNALTDTLTLSTTPAVFHIPDNSGRLAISDSGVSALGTRATAIGYGSDASGVETTAVGWSAQATGANSVAIGRSASATQLGGAAVGYACAATGSRALAVGYGSTASGSNGIALGNSVSNTTADALICPATTVIFGTNQSSSGVTSDFTLRGGNIGGLDGLTVGSAVTVQGGSGEATNSTNAGGVGGAVNLTGGAGGVGSATGLAGVGGGVNITAGAAGTNSGGGGAAGGNIVINSGAGTGSAANGTVDIQINGSSTFKCSTTPAVFHIPNNSGGLAISDSSVSGLGTSSTAIGYLSDAIGNNCVAVGNGAQAGSSPGGSFRFSVAMGYNASALYSSCVVIGYNASAASSSSVVIGATASAASNGVSIGWAAVASANSVVIGESASGSGATNLVAIGKGASASTAGIAIGLNASSVGGIAIGEGAVATGSHCVIGKASAGKIGIYTLGATYLGVASPQVISLRPEPVVDGTTDTAGASFTIQGGQSTGTGIGGSIIFQVSPAAGSTATTQNSYSTAFTIPGKLGYIYVGNSSERLAISDSAVSDLGTNATAVGYMSDATSNFASAFGNRAQATGLQSTAIGYNAQATQSDATVMGRSAAATGASSCVVIGSSANANTASTSAIVAVGTSAAVNSSSSVAVGSSASVSTSSSSSVALGASSSVTNLQSVALGANASATNQNTTAVGQASSAAYTASIALGRGATTGAANQLMVGATGAAINDAEIVQSTNGAQFGIRYAETVISTSSGTTADTAGSFIPANALVLCVVARVTTAVTGPAAIDIGVPGDATRYADDAATALDTEITGVDSAGYPRFYATQSALRVSSGDGATSFTGGTVRVGVTYIMPTVMTS